MTNARRQIGKTGEMLAGDYLENHGYTILERNYRCRFGEIDIIARDEAGIAFVEVKRRTSHRFGDPKWAITPQKQKKISMTALWYLKSKSQQQVKARFDVLTIQSEKGDHRIRLLKNAFELAYSGRM